MWQQVLLYIRVLFGIAERTRCHGNRDPNLEPHHMPVPGLAICIPFAGCAAIVASIYVNQTHPFFGP